MILLWTLSLVVSLTANIRINSRLYRGCEPIAQRVGAQFIHLPLNTSHSYPASLFPSALALTPVV